MDYLKTYEENNLREDTSVISLENAKDILNNLVHYDPLDYIIYRGVNLNNDNIYMVDPKKIERKSANTFNYYTWLIDNSNEWKEYPKRSKSLICSSSVYASDYGNLFRIIPLKNKKIGVCPYEDMWDSFILIRGFYSLHEFNDALDNIFDELELPRENKNDFFNSLKIIDKYSLKNIKNINNLSKLIFESDKPTRKFLENLLDPDRNNFRLLKYTELIKRYNIFKGSHELWTDSECLLVPYRYKFIKELGFRFTNG